MIQDDDVFDSKITDISKKIAFETTNFGEKNEYGIDPATIALIISIIIELVKLIRECRKDKKQILKMVNEPSLMERWYFRKIAGKFSKNKHYKKSIIEAAFKVGKQTTIQDVEELF